MADAHDDHVFNNDLFKAMLSESIREVELQGISHTALADTLIMAVALTVQKLGRKHQEMRTGPGYYYIYDSWFGIWRAIAAFDVRIWVQLFEGLDIGKKTLGINKGHIDGVCSGVFHSHKIAKRGPMPSQSSGIAFKNGFVTVSEDGVDLQEHSSEHHAQHYVDEDYTGESDCRVWKTFLDSVFYSDEDKRDKIAMLQEFLGAALIGQAYNFDRCLVLLGTGANGKSLFIDAVASLFPETSVVSSSPDSWAEPVNRVVLHGAALNTVHELPTTRVLETDHFKTIVRGELVQARALYKDPVSFRPSCAHIFATNSLPTVKDYSEGFWRRFLIVTFNENFEMNGRKGDRVEILRAIKKERAAIISWCLEGAVRLKNNMGYTFARSHTVAVSSWQDDADSIRGFLSSCCVTHDGWTRSSIFYRDYKDWCEANGRLALSRNKMGNRIAGAGVEKKRTAEGVSYNLTIKSKLEWKEYQ